MELEKNTHIVSVFALLFVVIISSCSNQTSRRPPRQGYDYNGYSAYSKEQLQQLNYFDVNARFFRNTPIKRYPKKDLLKDAAKYHHTFINPLDRAIARNPGCVAVKNTDRDPYILAGYYIKEEILSFYIMCER